MSTEIRQGLYNTLAGTATITSQLAGSTSIYHGNAPANAAYPFIVFWKQRNVRTRAFGSIAFEAESWMVKAVDRNTTSNLAESISQSVSDVLTNGTITVTGKVVQDIFPTGDIDYLETDGDQTFRHHGLTFRIVTS